MVPTVVEDKVESKLDKSLLFSFGDFIEVVSSDDSSELRVVPFGGITT